jgi:tryptophanyl-tRNA synthetase
MKTVFSGIQPSGNLHIGNYIGAISQWVKVQENTDAIFCIVDMHAITVPQDPKTLKEKVLEVAALYLACGIDPKKSHLFIQSENPDHAYLAWLLNCITSFGQLQRMTQFKEKSRKAESLLDFRNIVRREFEKENMSSAGLFDYPVLMAADILLYQTDEVPVGEDQKQHIELTRDLAEKFNKKFGDTFKLPNPVIQKETARIMSLQSPSSKMSKSDKDPLGTINLLDNEKEIREKVRMAVSDSEKSINKDIHSKYPGPVDNLLTIYSAFNNQALEKSYEEFNGRPYGEFKTVLADLLVLKLSEIQKKYHKIRNDDNQLRQILDEGRDYVKEKSSKTLQTVKEKMGLI